MPKLVFAVRGIPELVGLDYLPQIQRSPEDEGKDRDKGKGAE